MPLGLHCPRLTELFVYSKLTINERTDYKTKLCIQNLRLLLVQKMTYPTGFEFSNLEFLYFNEPIFSIFLSDFPCLKEIYYFDGFSIVHEELRDHLENLLEQKRSLKRDQLSVYFDGFELNGRDDFEALNVYRTPNNSFCALDLNEQVIQDINGGSFNCKFNFLFKELMLSDLLDDQLLGLSEEDALVKSMLKSVTSVTIKNPLSRKSLNFFDLSERFRHVSSVRVYVELSQALLDRLPTALPHLVDFTYRPKCFDNHFLNFKFLAKFKSLRSLLVDERLISIEEMRLVFENVKFIRLVCFCGPNYKSVTMRRLSRRIKETVFQADWELRNCIYSRARLLDYLAESKWLKNNSIGERKEETPASLPHLCVDLF